MSRRPSRIGFVARATIALIALCIALPMFAADPNKVVRFAFRVAETSFDPAKESDRYSAFIMEAVFDTLLNYDYLARPAKLVPGVIEAMPEVADGGATYTFHLKKGIYFTPDPAFNGKKRELVAQDFVYSIKRFYDPKNHSPYLYYFENKIIGADEVMERAKKTEHYDYDATIPGLQALDRYTLRIRLKEPDFNFLYVLATPTALALAREVVERYGDDIGGHPVGTNAYMLKEWRRSSKIVLVANPDYREDYFHTSASDTEEARAIAANLQGRRLPLVGRIEVSDIEEPQPRWLGFFNKEFEYIEDLPNEFVNIVAPNGKLAPNLAKAGIRMQRTPDLEITLTAYYNMDDPVIGGYTAEKVALRRAMNLGYNQREEIMIARKGQAIAAESPIPPGAAGYDPNFHSIATEYDPARAKALLDLFGYKDVNGDGYRELPDGKPLVLEFGSPPDAATRDLDFVWKKSMDAIGINITFKKERWPDLNKEAKARTLQVGSFYAWFADYPDGDNFLSLLYGPNSSPENNFANFNLPEYNHLYERARTMPDSPERTKLYDDMTRVFLAYAPWKLGVHRIQTHLAQPWLLNYVKHPIMLEPWKYLDVDLDVQRKMTR
jgi:peptide/nickel transport system substrate-binding protein